MARRPLSEPPPSLVVDLPAPSPRAPRQRFRGFWRLFYVVRVGFLLGLLAIVSVWGLEDHRSRQSRLDWERPLDIALVLIEQEPLGPATVRALRARLPEFERQLTREFSKYREQSGAPFRFYLFGPVKGAPPPQPSRNPHFVDQLVESVARQVYAQQIDRLASVPLFGFDSHIYIVAHPVEHDEQAFVEGFSEQSGRNGFVDVELDPSMVDFALFVTAHELFHTLGASDKYDGLGNTLLPDGLANPTQRPLYPQAQAEVMAHGRPLAPGLSEAPTLLGELGVGPVTARELHWVAARTVP